VGGVDGGRVGWVEGRTKGGGAVKQGRCEGQQRHHRLKFALLARKQGALALKLRSFLGKHLPLSGQILKHRHVLSAYKYQGGLRREGMCMQVK
jgi:hypothetical protein